MTVETDPKPHRSAIPPQSVPPHQPAPPAGGGRVDKVTAVLPAPVRAAMAVQQESSEILIGWIQLALVVGFGALYAISPKTFPPEATLHPIPWMLGAYCAFTVLRLRLAYRRRLAGWFLALSVVADVALLLGTIWSFDVQYMQPAAFYLKAPTVLYLFIFIALRTLRFEPRYVVLAGVAAAGGWVLMVVYAAFLDGMNSPITRDYVLYLTTNAILVGAEFDKVVSILTVTAILAIAIVRARRLLVEAVRESLAARELSRFFARDVADRITDLDHAVEIGRGEVREAAVVFVDMRGFSQMAAEIPPDDLIALLSDYQRSLVPILQHHGGSIDKFLGDGIMATFGATRTGATPAADGLRAVDAVMAEASAWRQRRLADGLPAPAVGAAVAAGPVVFGAVGDDTRLEYTVIGSAVNLAAKLEKHTKTEGVRALTDRATFERARSEGYTAEQGGAYVPDILERRHVIGLDDPVDLVILAT